MSHGQPGPYTPPPQQPPMPPTAYGQPQQQPPYGQPGGYYGQPQPNAPYGQQPYPGMPAPYPPPIPPQRGGKGKVIGITVAALVVVGAIIGGATTLLKNSSSSVSDDGKRYKLTMPGTVLTDYTKDPDFTDQDVFNNPGARRDLRIMGVKNPESTAAAYENDRDSSDQKMLRTIGVWGEIGKPENVVDGMFTSLAKSAKRTTVEGSPQTVTPPGFDNAVMKCQYTHPGGGDDIVLPLCIWADHSTAGVVYVGDKKRSAKGLKIPFDEAAEKVAKLRTEIRVEIKK
ncbi:hypothetical protein CTZ27_08175 [Streptomyces griseocarneus]|nr:hypothetical protein CTZ27_08175 [Streptomyces griseocarneus]